MEPINKNVDNIKIIDDKIIPLITTHEKYSDDNFIKINSYNIVNNVKIKHFRDNNGFITCSGEHII